MPASDLAQKKPLRFSVVPQSTVIEVERPNAFKVSDDDPDTVVVELKAWPAGPGCPVWVEIAIEAAHDEYLASIREEMARREADGQNVTRTVTDPATGETREEQSYTGPTHLLSQVIATYRRNLLCAAIEGLAEHEAALWARADGPWEEILVSLGRWQRRTTTPAPDETTDPEAQAGEEASAPSSPA